MKKHGTGKPWSKDIDTIECGERVKDYGVKKSSLPKTSGMEPVANSQVEDRPYSKG